MVCEPSDFETRMYPINMVLFKRSFLIHLASSAKASGFGGLIVPKVVPISTMQKACSFFGFATCALATKRHGGARIFTGSLCGLKLPLPHVLPFESVCTLRCPRQTLYHRRSFRSWLLSQWL